MSLLNDNKSGDDTSLLLYTTRRVLQRNVERKKRDKNHAGVIQRFGGTQPSEPMMKKANEVLQRKHSQRDNTNLKVSTFQYDQSSVDSVNIKHSEYHRPTLAQLPEEEIEHDFDNMEERKNRISDSNFSTGSSLTLGSRFSTASTIQSPSWSVSDTMNSKRSSDMDFTPRSRTNSGQISEHSYSTQFPSSYVFNQRRGSDTTSVFSYTTARSSAYYSDEQHPPNRNSSIGYSSQYYDRITNYDDANLNSNTESSHEFDALRRKGYGENPKMSLTRSQSAKFSSHNKAPSPTPSNSSGKTSKTAEFSPDSTFTIHALKRWSNSIGPINAVDLSPYVCNRIRTLSESKLYLNVLHRRLEVNYYLKDKTLTSKKRFCDRCVNELETIEHALYECVYARKFWANFGRLMGNIIQSLDPSDYKPTFSSITNERTDFVTLRDVVFFFPEIRKKLTENEIHILLVMHSVALWAIWGARGNTGNGTAWGYFTSRLKARITLEYSSALEGGTSGTVTPSSESNASVNEFPFPTQNPQASSSRSSLTMKHRNYSQPSLSIATVPTNAPFDMKSLEDILDGKAPGKSMQNEQNAAAIQQFKTRWCTNSEIVDINSFGQLVFPYFDEGWN
ncbi:hypothetical protein HK098_001569 [Nowakowskiella sp. JEL0407]|nr:hypothetical protein HK098_001569 [Nowakowskiella sp. JEL0407]